MLFDNKVCMVTGAAQGLGEACVKKFLEQGAFVAALDLNESLLNEKYGNNDKVLCIKCDVTSEDEWKNAVATVMEKCGKIDVLVNNAARFIFKNLDEITLDEFNAVVAVNLNGVFLGTKYVSAVMKEGAAIVNINSIASERSGMWDGFQAAYSASKAAVKGMTQYSAAYLAPRGIRVNQIIPGGINSPAYQATMAANPAYKEALLKCIPLAPYVSEPEDLAEGVLFLASDKARTTTGASLRIDCGIMTM